MKNRRKELILLSALTALLALSSCKKVKDETYKKFVGQWNCVNSDSGINIEFRKNGWVNFHLPFERDIRYKVVSMSPKIGPFYKINVKGVDWIEYSFDNTAESKYSGIIHVFVNPTGDSLATDTPLYWDQGYVSYYQDSLYIFTRN